ncbi:HAD-IIB family hydrolase [Reyranella sp.]|uniref:HAD family hydrolase n=1 Tax=Reyranella sp. TaxID=1929291 RepID=UPI003BA9DE91
MFFRALATDYDGTIAHHGAVDEETCQALQRLRQSGRRLVLVTGRELADLKHVSPQLGLFDRVVAENGAVLYRPDRDETTLLAPAPPPAFVARLLARKVEPLSIGHCIVATWEPHQAAVLETIHELGLELKIVFNKGAVMVLPPDVTKARGLEAALADLNISPRNVIGVGDAENDHALFQACGCAAAVANALPPVKEAADIRLRGEHGSGVAELISRIVDDDERLMPVAKLGLPFGTDTHGNDVPLMPDRNVLVIGRSGCGKSRFARMLTEKMVERRFSFCVIDPEGDYHGLEHSVSIAEPAAQPHWEEAAALLRQAAANVVVNTVALDAAGRRRLVGDLLKPISDLHAKSGRPHWVVFDEAHQTFPAGHDTPLELPQAFPASLFLTVSPENLCDDILGRIDAVIAFDGAAVDRLGRLGKVPGFRPTPPVRPLGSNEVFAWFRDDDSGLRTVRIEGPRQVHRRHTGKYAVGDVGEEHSFHFRSPANLAMGRARNACEFVHLARQLDDATWEHHLRRSDYSAWFRDVIRDEELAQETRKVEDDRSLSPDDSRSRIADLVLSRYAAPES